MGGVRPEGRPVQHAPSSEGGADGGGSLQRGDALATRLRAAREAFGLTQRAVAQRINMPLASYKDYEAGKRVPGGEALGLLIRAGINANWLITGNGPMLMAELGGGKAAAQPPLDWKMLADAITDVESRISGGVDLSPGRKAQLIGLVYDYYRGTGKREPSLLDRFLKLVSD